MADHEFVIHLAHGSVGSKIEIDGHDISSLLRGIEIKASVNAPTEIVLTAAHGKKVALTAVVAGEQVVING